MAAQGYRYIAGPSVHSPQARIERMVFRLDRDLPSPGFRDEEIAQQCMCCAAADDALFKMPEQFKVLKGCLIGVQERVMCCVCAIL